MHLELPVKPAQNTYSTHCPMPTAASYVSGTPNNDTRWQHDADRSSIRAVATAKVSYSLEVTQFGRSVPIHYISSIFSKVISVKISAVRG